MNQQSFRGIYPEFRLIVQLLSSYRNGSLGVISKFGTSILLLFSISSKFKCKVVFNLKRSTSENSAFLNNFVRKDIWFGYCRQKFEM